MRFFLTCFLLAVLNCAQAEVLAGWEGFANESSTRVNHLTWQGFLNKYLYRDESDQTYVDYSRVSKEDASNVHTYIQTLETINPLKLNANEQKAYWVNLYNAATVAVILDEYPIKSIRDIDRRFTLVPGGPWDRKLVTLNDQPLTLNNIEHDIVRPKFNDFRIHFALNCASIGCPNLADSAYTAENIEQLLTQATLEFINHPRGVDIEDNKLTVSSIFKWYRDDFVDSEKALPNFLAQFAEPKLQMQLKAYRGKIKYKYDWALNEVK